MVIKFKDFLTGEVYEFEENELHQICDSMMRPKDISSDDKIDYKETKWPSLSSDDVKDIEF